MFIEPFDPFDPFEQIFVDIDPLEELRKYGLTASPLENPEEFYRQLQLASKLYFEELEKQDLFLDSIVDSGTEQTVEHMDPTPPTPTQPDCYGYEFTPFDADGYVREHCHSYIYGLVSESDVATIENDSTLSYEKREEAKEKLEHLAILYY